MGWYGIEKNQIVVGNVVSNRTIAVEKLNGYLAHSISSPSFGTISNRTPAPAEIHRPFQAMPSSTSLHSRPLLHQIHFKPSQHPLIQNDKNPIFTNNTHTVPSKLPFTFFQTHSISTPLQKTPILPTCKQDPDADFSDFPSVDQLIDPALVGSCISQCTSVKEARRVHSTVIKCFGNSSTYVCNNLVSVYVRVGDLLEARKVFDQMSDRSVVSWTAMINGYSKIGSDDEILGLFVELIRNGIQTNSRIFVCVLNVCGRRSDFKLGKQIHACIVKGNWRNSIVDNTMVHFYVQCRDTSGATQAFNMMAEPDVVAWTALISACIQDGDGEKAFSLFSKMHSGGFHPNEYTFCSVLKACGMEKNLEFGKQLHALVVKKMVKVDVFLGTSLVSMYAKCEEIVCARKFFNGMKKRNTVTWTSMIAGYTHNGLGKEAISLFRLMKRRHIHANNLTVVSILGACGLVKASSLGKEVHAQILKNFVQSNVYVGSTLVWFYCKCGDYKYAASVLKMMPHRDVVSWTAMISGCARLGQGSEALNFMNEMLHEGVKPNPFTYSSALKACAQQEAILQGKSIHSSVKKTHAFSNVFVGSALIGMYAKCGYVSEATHVFDSMPERNFVSWKAMVVGYANNGLSLEALKLMHRMQEEDIEVDDYTLSMVLGACVDVEEGLKPLSN